MTTTLNPYLSFRDSTRAAMEFYRSIFGGELTMNTYGEFQAGGDPVEKDRIMHAALVSDGITLMAADTPSHMPHEGGGNFSLSLSGDDPDELRRYWDALSAGGDITMPLERQVWGDEFGMCRDRFGVHWMVNIHARP